MNPFARSILWALSLVPRHYSDVGEPAETRGPRFERYAAGMAEACDAVTCTGGAPGCRAIYRDRAECAGGLIELGRIESGFSEHILLDNCGPHECDRGRAVGTWQTHRVKAWDDSTWEAMHGGSIEAITLTATRTARLIAGGVGVCGSLAGSFGRYQSGGGCNSFVYEGAASRAVRFAAMIRVRLVKEESEAE